MNNRQSVLAHTEKIAKLGKILLFDRSGELFCSQGSLLSCRLNVVPLEE